MSSTHAEAYVIESDGTKTAIPVNFVDDRRAGGAADAQATSMPGCGNAWRAAANGPRRPVNAGPFYAPNAQGYAAQAPFTTVDAQTAAPRRSLHIGRRILGLGIAAIGVPLLILPGPGLALIGLGLLMVVMP